MKKEARRKLDSRRQSPAEMRRSAGGQGGRKEKIKRRSCPPLEEFRGRKEVRRRWREGGNHFTSTDFGRNASISAPPSVLGDDKDAAEEEEELSDEELATVALGRLYM